MKESFLLHEIERGPDGAYRWESPVDLAFFRGNLVRVMKYFGLGALVFAALGLIPSLFFQSWEPVLTSALWAAAFLALVGLICLIMLASVRRPRCRYELCGDYICQPSGRGSTYFHFKDVKTLSVYRNAVELRDGWRRMRVFVPAADFPFVLDYIKTRVSASCDIRYEREEPTP